MSDHIKAIRETAEQADQRAAVIATDSNGTIVYWNKQAEELYGWRSAEAMGRDVLEVMPTTLSQNDAAEIMNTLLSGKSWSGPFMVRDRAGHPMIVHVEDIPVMHEGAIVGVVGVSRLTSVV